MKSFQNLIFRLYEKYKVGDKLPEDLVNARKEYYDYTGTDPVKIRTDMHPENYKIKTPGIEENYICRQCIRLKKIEKSNYIEYICEVRESSQNTQYRSIPDLCKHDPDMPDFFKVKQPETNK